MMRDLGYFYRLSKNIPVRYTPDSGFSKQVNSIIREVFDSKTPKIVPNVIDGKSYFGRNIKKQISPIDNKKVICEYSETSETQLNLFLENFTRYKKSISSLSEKDITNIFTKASSLLVDKYADKIMAYTIIGQGKSQYEAEIDAVCELGDFWNFNTDYYKSIIEKQPFSPIDCVNESVYNPLHGFVAAITPFNFTAIGGNLATVPLFFKNVTIWKPANNAILSNYLVYQIMLEAGMPEEAIAFTPSDPNLFTQVVLDSPSLGGVLFTGSTTVFDKILSQVYQNVSRYNSYPRIVGETGGKNWHFLDYSLDKEDIDTVAEKTVQSAFGYSGQKCSACSIAYVPDALYDDFRDALFRQASKFIIGESFENYTLINEEAYDRVENVIETIKNSEKHNIIYGGKMNSNGRYYCEPTIVECLHHSDPVFNQEFFAPILALYRYSNRDMAMRHCVSSNKYALTGSVFSNSEKMINFSREYFKEKCGNFYINDKSTGSVVGQQPFGGSGRSGTNDKAGDINLLYRMFNQQTIKRSSL